ncbi:hypothetical protein RJ641_006797 [Dillenia turbinata]|uniref:Uncharacterized protein n=1 Tax=Dillenia turbinata TaxID=194707 RepID=A0AAN8VDZ3_9MAGN
MAADNGKKSKVAADDSEHIDGELVLSIEKLQEVQDELEKVNEEASDKIVEIEQKYNARLRPTFKENPYFEDIMLTKNICFSDDGTTNVAATAIKWREGMGPLALDKECENFFTWFDTRKDLVSDEVAEVIKEDFWTNPLKYFNNDSDDDEEDEEEQGEEGEDTD